MRDLIEEALVELHVIAPGESASAEDAALGLQKLIRLFDNWNAEDRAVYAETVLSNTLTASLQPHTLGPSGATWTVTQRPIAILAAMLVVGTTRYPVNIRSTEWWMGLALPELTGEIPTDLNYRADWANGSIYLWPVPTAAYTLELLVRFVLTSAVSLSTTFSLPPGYRDAITLTLAEDLATPFETDPSPTLAVKARQARARIFGHNDPDMTLCLDGMGSSSRSSFDARSRH